MTTSLMAIHCSSGLTCPPTDFIEEPFLLSVKKFLSGGLFVANLVSRSTGIRKTVISRMKSVRTISREKSIHLNFHFYGWNSNLLLVNSLIQVFTQVFSLELEEDVNEVLFASDTAACTEMDRLPEATAQLQRLLKFPLPANHIVTENIKCLN